MEKVTCRFNPACRQVLAAWLVGIILIVGGCAISEEAEPGCVTSAQCPAHQICQDNLCVDQRPPDEMYVPQPDAEPLGPPVPATWECTACDTDADCTAGAGCYDIPGGARTCLWQGCEVPREFGGTGCPTGYACDEVAGAPGRLACVPRSACCDVDGDEYGYGGSCSGPDCDEMDPEINPGASEICDGVDQNCNYTVDDDALEAGVECEVETLCMAGATACVDGAIICEDGAPLPVLTPCGDGRACDEAGACTLLPNCQGIMTTFPDAPDGIYTVTLDGAQPEGQTVYCDFTTAGGGWTLCHSSRCANLASNSAMPRCGLTRQRSCYAGKFALTNSYAVDGSGRGVWWVGSDSRGVQRLERDLTWLDVGSGNLQSRGACSSTYYCGGSRRSANSRCLFSTLRDGGCCTNPTQRNFCI